MNAVVPIEQITLETAVGELENLTDECQILLQSYMWNDNGSVHSVEMTDTYKPLLSCSLIEITRPTVDSIYRYKAQAMRDICVGRGYEPPLHISKKRLAEWCVDNAFDCFLSFVFAPSFKKQRNAVYKYLRRKFDWEYYVNPNTMREYRYPAGSENNKFPDDSITALLNLYGHNRCINGYDPDCHTVITL